MTTGVWTELHTGGVICRTGRKLWLARPDGRCGMNSIRSFKSEASAVQYAAGGPALRFT